MIPDFTEQEELSTIDIAIINLLDSDALFKLAQIQVYLEELMHMPIAPNVVLSGCIDTIYKALFDEEVEEASH